VDTFSALSSFPLQKLGTIEKSKRQLRDVWFYNTTADWYRLCNLNKIIWIRLWY